MNTTVPDHHDTRSPFIDAEYEETDLTTQLSYVLNDNSTLSDNLTETTTANHSILLYATQEFFE